MAMECEYYNKIIFYVVMKQPRSSSSVNSRPLAKKALFPTFKYGKQGIKVQQLYASNKSELFFNVKLIPLEIVAQRKFGEPQKILINSTDVIVIESNKNYKGVLNYHNSLDSMKEWIELNLGQIFAYVRIKKMGDENTFTHSSHLVSWQRGQQMEKKLLLTINIKQVMKGSKKKQEVYSINSLIQKNDKNKQIKLFITNLIIKKQNKKLIEKIETEPKLTNKRSNIVFRNKIYFKNNDECSLLEPKNGSQTTNNLWNNGNNGIHGIIGIKSFRKEIIDVNKLKDSKFTGKSEKQTSIGDHNVDQSSLMIHNLQSRTSNINSLDADDEKRRSKFDSQPYFYQNCIVKTEISNKNISMNKFTNHSKQQKASSQQLQIDIRPQNDTQQIIECLQNKSEHKSQQEVEQDIKRVEPVEESIVQGTFQEKNQEINEKQDMGSGKKKIGESSGTLYQSKYQ